MDFWNALVHWSQLRPDHLAVRSHDQELSYVQLADLTAQLATKLVTVGDRRIGILTSDPADMALAFQGCALADKSLVVLDPAWPRALLGEMLSRLRCTHLIARSVPEALADKNLTLISFPNAYSKEPLPLTSPAPDRELLIICTSGTTSRPKAIRRSARSWIASIAAGATILGATADSVTLCPGPISHGLGLYSLVESLHTGGTFIGPGRWDLNRTGALADSAACTRIVSVPTILERILTSIEATNLAHVSTVVSGGESLGSNLVDQLYQLPSMKHCIEYFGSSEHSLIAYAQRQPGQISTGVFTGKLFPTVKVHLHDQDSNTGLGQVFVQSEFNATEYLPETAAPITRCKNSTSINDRGVLVDHQTICFYPRGDGMMNLNGNNVHASEIRLAFAQLGLPQSKIQLRIVDNKAHLVAYLCSKPLDSDELKTSLRELLPAYKIPHEVIFLSHWPQTFSGKARIPFLEAENKTILGRLRIR